MNILEVPMRDNEPSAATVGEYLCALLAQLWADSDGFSGKHPFGNSGWQYDVYFSLCDADVMDGLQDDFGDWDFDGEEIQRVDKLLLKAIWEMR